MAVVNGVVAVVSISLGIKSTEGIGLIVSKQVKAIINGIVAVCHAIISCITCGKAGRKKGHTSHV